MRLAPVEPTRVYRFYRDGKLIGDLRGEPEPDDVYPEDWVASTTHASNPASRAVARELFSSPFGKTEAWIVLATRADESEVWIGLRQPVAAAEYRSWIDSQDTEALLGSLNHLPVRAGDVLFVPAGVPHAIGAGALIAELQEPTDFSIVCEADNLPEPADRFGVLLVLEGGGEVDGRAAKAGDAFALPAGCEPFEVAGEMRVLRCLAPEPEYAPRPRPFAIQTRREIE